MSDTVDQVSGYSFEARENLPEPFNRIGFLWDAVTVQTSRVSFADEVMEDRLGTLIYVDDWESLPESAQIHIRNEISQFRKTENAAFLVQNAVAQSLIIAVDCFVKDVSYEMAHADLGPLVPAPIIADRNNVNIEHPWARCVRVAGNYVRHSGEWKREAILYEDRNHRNPEIADFERPDTQRNLRVLCEIMFSTVAELVRYDASYRIAQRLNLTNAESCVDLFEQWRLPQ
jgi:hypothetical protein